MLSVSSIIQAERIRWWQVKSNNATLVIKQINLLRQNECLFIHFCMIWRATQIQSNQSHAYIYFSTYIILCFKTQFRFNEDLRRIKMTFHDSNYKSCAAILISLWWFDEIHHIISCHDILHKYHAIIISLISQLRHIIRPWYHTRYM